MFNPFYETYRQYQLMDGGCDLEREINTARSDLLADMISNPDYHCDTKRNGVVQPLLLTRSGEQHSYNVICRPGDELFAGDIIDAFGSKWIVMEARADSTTHKTGVMYQCNKLFRFQNFTSDIIERWGIVDISGYSSSFNSNTQMQHSSEQVAIYMPFDDDTAKIYVDKRLPSHVGYDQFGNKILFSFKITGTNPVSESYNNGDHLLMLKAERFLYAQEKDNLELEICDYIRPDETVVDPPASDSALRCGIVGGTSIRIGGTRIYKAIFKDSDGNTVDDVKCIWSIDGDGASYIETDDGIKVSVTYDTTLIGSDIIIRAVASDSTCSPAEYRVEVTGIA